MEFTKRLLLNIIFDDFDEEFIDDVDPANITVIEDEIVDTRRWTTTYKMIFKYDDKYYKFYYDRPSTEMQDGCGYFEYKKDNDLINVEEVKPVEKTIIVYE